MNQSYASRGLFSSAVCPGFVDTPMSKEAKGLEPEDMITAEDVAEAVRMILRQSPRSYIPEVLIARAASSDPSGV
jgi:NAD(P)-dependent dehydrogenase (short-subunit alcohol dehydrogenase family)